MGIFMGTKKIISVIISSAKFLNFIASLNLIANI